MTNKFQLPTRRQIENCKTNPNWGFGNDILYKMCRDNFKHDKPDVILAKVIIIGRTYAATVERRKNKSETDGNGDDFYIKTVAPTFIKSKLYDQLDKLKQIEKVTTDNFQQVLKVHLYLTTTLFGITKMNKRSFASKYLHFHLPDIFFIYDSRVVAALRNFTGKVSDELEPLTRQRNINTEYAKFYCKCFDLKLNLEKYFDSILTNRQLDNLLIEVSNKK